MVLTVYDEERHIRSEKAISWEEGWKKSLKEILLLGESEIQEKWLKEGRFIMLLDLICDLLRSHSDLSILTSSLGHDEATVSRLLQIAAPFAPDYNVIDVIVAWENSR